MAVRADFPFQPKNDFLFQVWAIEIKWVSGVSVTAVVQGYWYTSVHDNAGTHVGLTPSSQDFWRILRWAKQERGDSSLSIVTTMSLAPKPPPDSVLSAEKVQ